VTKILFVYPEHGRRPYFPTAIGYLSASILQVEPTAKIDILDLNIETNRERLKDESYEYILISGLSAHFFSIERVIHDIKSSNKKSIVVLGGIIVTSMPTKIIESLNADIYVIGEGERTIQELIKGKNREEIEGVGYKDQTGQATINRGRAMIEDLDIIPFPAWHLFSEKYMKIYRETDDLWDDALPILASRGCPMRCNFCFRNFNGTYRSRSIENVLAEIDILIKQHKIGVITFIDEYFFVNKTKIQKFCQEIHNRQMKFIWSCAIRVELADKELFKSMKEAGCFMVQVGIEHGNQKMLDAMNKKSTVEENERFLNIAKECRLYIGMGIIIGYPGETPETITDGEKMLHRVQLLAGYHLIQAFPGTPLWDFAKEKGFITDEIEYLRNSFDSDRTLKINFTEMSTEYLLSERTRIQNSTRKYELNNGFDKKEKIKLKLRYYFKHIKQGDVGTVSKKIREDLNKVFLRICTYS